MSDADLNDATLERARAAEHDALEAVYRALHPHVLAFLRAHAPDEAEDLASDTFIALAGRLPTFNGDWDGLRALTFTIARRRLQDRARRNTRRRTDPMAIEDVERGAGFVDGEREAMRAGGGDAVKRLVDLLPPDQAQVVLLRVIGDLSVEETATALGKRPGAVRALQHRAMRRLARELRAAPLDAEDGMRPR